MTPYVLIGLVGLAVSAALFAIVGLSRRVKLLEAEAADLRGMIGVVALKQQRHIHDADTPTEIVALIERSGKRSPFNDGS